MPARAEDQFPESIASKTSRQSLGMGIVGAAREEAGGCCA
jgi:hypothetical protein